MTRIPGVGTLEPEKVAQIIELAKEGKFCAEIARLVGCSKRTVYNYKERLNLK